MKRKYSKIISLLLTVIILITTITAVTATPTASGTNYTYYVCSPGYDKYGTIDVTAEDIGTESNPFETVYDLVTWVNEKHPDLTAEDTVNVIIKQLSSGVKDNSNGVHGITSWTDQVAANEALFPEHKYTLYVTSPEGEDTRFLAFNYQFGTNVDMMLGGPVIFDRIHIVNVHDNTAKNIALEAYNATFTENCDFKYMRVSKTTATWNKAFSDMAMDVQIARAPNAGKTINRGATTYNLNSAKLDTFIFGSNRAYKLFVTFEDDVNINVNNANLPLSFQWGSATTNTANSNIAFNKNLNINIKDAASITNTVGGGALVTVDGALQVIYPEDIAFNMSSVSTLKADNQWYLKNKTGNADALTFTATAGVYNVAEGLTVSAVDADGNTVKNSENGVLDLTSVGAGTYSIVEGEVSGGGEGGGEEPEEPEITVTHNYDKYITYRSDLDNTRAKLKANGDVNVVYFGGSVTAGSGSTKADGQDEERPYCWRALTGEWIKETFPNATVENYDQAVGETGTYLGSYRVARDVIAKNPDLLFIEYSINDLYNSTGYARASMQFETIVRQVKEKLPDCDIVTILVTDYGQAANARKGVLHAAARAHSDISEIYGLPVINVGFALADLLPTGWEPKDNWKLDTDWQKYVSDNVHPSDDGYEVYFNVIKEYLSNNLIMEYNGETEFTELTQLPTMVNKYLFNGDVTFIKPSQDMITVNTENTTATKSRKLQYRTDRGPGSMPSDGYGYDNGAIVWFGGASYIDCGDILEFEFTGTEIVMIPNTYNTDNPQYLMVSIDGGEPYRVDQESRPFVLATNLSSGKHTIKFTELAQTASLIIGGFCTRDVTKATNTLNICDLVKADECINNFVKPDETDFFDYSNNWSNDAADIAALKQILLAK